MDAVTEINDWEESGATDPAIADRVQVPVVTESAQPVAVDAPAEPETSIEEHEETHETRDNRGRFKHRAQSQKARPEDVATISEYTKRIKLAEAAAGADIVQKPGESPRVFELRRRAELAERRAAVANAPVEAAPVVEAPKPQALVSRPVVAAPPPVKAAKDDPEPDQSTYEDLTKWMRDHSRWSAREELREAHRVHAEQTQAEQRRQEGQRITQGWEQSKATAAKKYPDFATVIATPYAKLPPLLQRDGNGEPQMAELFVLEDETGADVLYHLLKNPTEAARLEAYADNPRLMHRELTLLGQRLTTLPSRMPAVSTGAAAAPLAQSVPRLPTPVKTGPTRTGDGLPSDDDSLEAHESAFYKSRRRR